MTLPLLLFDGDCGLCAATVAWLCARAGAAAPSAVAWQTLPSLPAGVDAARLERELVLVDGGSVLGGFDAFVALAPRVPPLRPLRWLARLAGARLVGRVVYRLVARHRRALSRLVGLRACALPRPPSV